VIRSIILKKQDRGEADELVVFVTRDLGWLRGVAKNSRKSRVRFGGHLEPFSLVDLTLRQRKKDDLVWIDESHVVNGFLGIRPHIGKVALAAYFLELASIFQAEANADAELFDFLRTFLDTVETAGLNPVRFMLDEIRLLGLLGYAPRFDACPLCGEGFQQGERALFSPNMGGAVHPECARGKELDLPLSPDTLALLRRGLELEGEAVSRLRLSKRGTVELRNLLSAFVRHLRGKEINSLLFLEKSGVWSDVQSIMSK